MSHINPKRPLSSDTIINIISDCMQQGVYTGTLPVGIESITVDIDTTNTIDTALYIQGVHRFDTAKGSGEYKYNISKEQRSNIIETLKEIGVYLPDLTTYIEIKAKRGEHPIITLEFFPAYIDTDWEWKNK